MIRFSVIIPVRGISNFLKENIQHLSKLDYQNFEVIIVSDNQEQFDFGGDTRFILINSNGSGNPCLKRNIAAAKSTGEVLAFLDDDAYPESNWLKEADRIFRDQNVLALGGPAVTPKNAGFLEKCSGAVLESWLASAGTRYRHIPLKEREIDDYPSVNLFVRKTAFERVGGFILDFWPGEDTKLCLDLIKAYGRNFNYSPRPVVYHHRRNLFAPHLKQISRYGKHRGQFTRIFPENSKLSVGYFIPSIFLLTLVLGPVLFTMFPFLSPLYFWAVYLYMSLVIIEGVRAFLKSKSLILGLYVGVGIFLTHIVYGTNFIIGFLKRPKLKLKAVDSKSGNYVEG